MNPKSRKVRVGLVFVSALLVFAIGGSLGAYFSSGSGSSVLSEVGDVLSLSRPAFAQGAGTTFLDDEAGMSIYTNTGQLLDLSIAATVYKTIEQQTEDYIVGSVDLPDQPESDDVHIFVHKDGWIVVYYLKAEVAGKIIDWDFYTSGKLSKTKLHVGLEQMSLAFGLNSDTLDKHYYHFQFTFASKWMIIIESQQDSGTDTCNVKIPSEYTVYERSWSHYTSYSSYTYSRFKIDSSTISSITGTDVTNYGMLTAVQLSPDIFHTVSVEQHYTGSAHVGIVLLYLEP